MTKNSRKLLPTVIAVLLLMTVMCAAVSANALQVSKTITSTGPYTYNVQTGVGSTIQYTMTVERPSLETHGFLVYVVTDTSPHPGGTVTTLDSNFYLNPGDTRTYYASHTLTLADFVGTPPYSLKNRCEADGIENVTHQAAFGGADTICDIEKIDEPPVYPGGDEFWAVEWFQSNPHQYTQFNISERIPGEKYLLTSGFYAPESCIHIWDNAVDPIDCYTSERLKFWNNDTFSIDDIYMNPVNQATHPGVSDIKLHGTFGEGAGDFDVIDPVTNLRPENPPYTDPIAPFWPQANQSPRKDFVTFNPAIMDHNDGYEIQYYECGPITVQSAKEKVFKRMWYEKEWFKDWNENGYWDVLLTHPNYPNYPDGDKVPLVLRLQEDQDDIHDALADGYVLHIWNNPEAGQGDSRADIYGPAIVQEFGYMFLDDNTMPIMIQNGGEVLIALAHDPNKAYRGLNSFDADLDGVDDPVRVESEFTVGIDIDQDGTVAEPFEHMGDGIELNGDESVVLVIDDIRLEIGDEVQFFDQKFNLTSVSGPVALSADILVSDNEGDASNRQDTVTLAAGANALLYRAKESAVGTTSYVKVKQISYSVYPAQPSYVILEIGRMFGQTHANIAANIDWNQKAFIVDEVFYNVVAIKAKDDCIKYIVFREKLPKMPIKLYGVHLKPWAVGELLPEMAPLCDNNHYIMEDVQSTWTHQKIGPKKQVGALDIRYTEESNETRFFGELKEIYWENETWSPETPTYNPYDEDENCEISIGEMGAALDDWNDGIIGLGEMGDVLDLWYLPSYC